MLQKIFQFIKKETVLTIAWIAAIVSMFFVKPGPEYVSYIDFRSLGILWSLMVIMEGLKKIGFFRSVGQRLLKKTSRVWQLAAVLIFLCFFSSMLITNDVALITFVPFALYILAQTDMTDLLIPVVVLQTLAANLGSMLTPVGNPQNLYLYGLSGMGFGAFIGLMLPYTALTLVMLAVSICFLKGKKRLVPQDALNGEGMIAQANDAATSPTARPFIQTAGSSSAGQNPEAQPFIQTAGSSSAGQNPEARNSVQLTSGTKSLIYGVLFLLALLVVLRLVPFWILCIAVLVVVFFLDIKVLVSVDYALLFTFVGFFLFTGNLGRIPQVSHFLTEMIAGREVLTGVLSSQIISNVPAALLLSGFTDRYSDLIIGVNLGGLGTLIASMASLISYKVLAHNYNEKKGRYFLVFTAMNVLYLAVLLLFWRLFG